MPCKDVGRDWSDAGTSQRTPRTAGHHQKRGRDKEGFFPSTFGGSMALLTA